MLWKSLLVWCFILVCAVVNGALREGVLVPALGQKGGYITSGLALSLIILGVAWLALPWLGARQTAPLVVIGLGWLLLTLVFEFSFGVLQGKPLSEILAAYTFRDGNLWPLVLVVTAVAPWWAAKLRGWV